MKYGLKNAKVTIAKVDIWCLEAERILQLTLGETFLLDLKGLVYMVAKIRSKSECWYSWHIQQENKITDAVGGDRAHIPY